MNTRGRAPLGEAYHAGHDKIIHFLASKQNADVNGQCELYTRDKCMHALATSTHPPAVFCQREYAFGYSA